jgi:PAS domain S-box-containing protein
METRHLRKDGTSFAVEVNIKWVRLDREYFIAIARDITERKLAEETLRDSEARFRQLAENINEAFWITDPAKSEMLYVSPAYETIWGRTCQSLYDSPARWLEAIHPDDRARVLHDISGRQERGEYNMVYRILRPDGEVRWIHDRAFPIRNEAGVVYRIVGTAEDITAQHRLEQQFRQAQKMEAIGTLAGGIAHDFNNILAAMTGYTELAKMKLGNHPIVHDYLEAVTQAGQRATALVRQILTFSRQQEQQERRSMQIGEVVDESLKLLRSSIPATIEFVVTQASNVAPVLADSTQIHQIMMNLGTNAWHAMRDRPGRLEVTLENFEVDRNLAEMHPRLRPGPYVRLSIGDTGCGMDAATIERIFEPFFTTKPPGEGTGLGLAVVHGIMESHDGVVTVYSHPGKGTIFHLYFPAYHEQTALPAASTGTTPRGEGHRILYVDDEAALAMLGQKTLKQLGYEVIVSTKVAEALDLVRQAPQRFDLVITDQTMPGMTGTDFAAQLLKIRPDLPIILTTGYSPYLTVERVRAMGIRDLLLKPQSLHALGQAAHHALTAHKPA